VIDQVVVQRSSIIRWDLSTEEKKKEKARSSLPPTSFSF
jgi:hypothetical protein